MTNKQKPTFRKTTVKQLVYASGGKEITEPAYRFSNGRTFTRRVKK